MKRWWFILLFPLYLMGAGWDPVPADIWTIPPGSPEGAQGAIVLKDWSRFGATDTEHTLRILILTEGGKAAAQLPPFSSLLASVEGRTVYPDGRTLDFNQAKDFADMVVESEGGRASHKILVPPGLTDHCMVDLHWRENGTYLWGNRADFNIQRAYPVRELELQLSRKSPMSSVWLRPPSMLMEKSNSAEYRIYRFKNLPALEDEPYSRVAWRPVPKLLLFDQPGKIDPYAGKGAETYWNAVISEIERPYYTRKLKNGRYYKALASEILVDLPSDPVQMAKIIVDHLYSKILNTSFMTSTEKTARTKKQDEVEIRPEDLNESAKRRWTNGEGMFYLAYQLFVDAKLMPLMLKVANRDQHFFHFELPDYRQFNNTLIGIQEKDNHSIVWCDPAIRFLPFGIINSDYQGTQALLMDFGLGSAQKYEVPVQDPATNLRTYRFEVHPDQTAERFTINTTYSGLEAWIARSKVCGIPSAEADRLTKEALEKRGNCTIEHVSILHPYDRNQPMVLEAEGRLEASGGRHRKINPFPTQECPLWIPSSWPQARKDPVVMAYESTYLSDSRIQVPEGWRATLPSNVDQQNAFGKVFWHAEEVQDEHGRAIKVHYEVTVSRMVAPATMEPALRDFLSWVQTGWEARIGLERVR